MSDGFVDLDFETLPTSDMHDRAKAFYSLMERRRSVRNFSASPVSRKLIEYAIQTASTSPSGAHKQPWTFVAVAQPGLKKQIRIAAEKQEEISYNSRMSHEWRDALRPLGTDASKPYLETAPWLVVLFEQVHGYNPNGSRQKHYYVKESVGIAAGMFIAAIHNMGLATLTHTPSPMAFLRTLLQRPDNERPVLLFPVGFPADEAKVPNLARKSLNDIAVFHVE